MDFYTITNLIVTMAILVAYINHRYIKMQTTIAIMSSSLLISFFLILTFKFLGLYAFEQKVLMALTKLDFHHLLIDGMLSFLLFAGALTIDIQSLAEQKLEIFTLASFSTIVSTFLIGIGAYYLLPLLGFHLKLIYCLLFGALISPTDPIAVIATFKQIGAPKQLETTVVGESLFNDGVGIVLFLTLYQVAFMNKVEGFTGIVMLFMQQAIGGILYGVLLGYLGSWLIKYADDHKIEILITIAVATGGYSIGQAIHTSAPLAMVVSGIIIGTYARHHAMTEAAKIRLDDFWELIDEILNCVLFLLIGFELLIIAKGNSYFIAALVAIPLVLLVRFLTVSFPVNFFKLRRSYCPYMITILVWGGLRGGLAVALALAIPISADRELILAMTYAVVSFSVIVQGITTKPLVRLSNE